MVFKIACYYAHNACENGSMVGKVFAYKFSQRIKGDVEVFSLASLPKKEEVDLVFVIMCNAQKPHHDEFWKAMGEEGIDALVMPEDHREKYINKAINRCREQTAKYNVQSTIIRSPRGRDDYWELLADSLMIYKQFIEGRKPKAAEHEAEPPFIQTASYEPGTGNSEVVMGLGGTPFESHPQPKPEWQIVVDEATGRKYLVDLEGDKVVKIREFEFV